MLKIIGIIVVFVSVFGGFLFFGGKIGVIIQFFEVLIIGGVVLGVFFQVNLGSMFMVVLKKVLKMFSNCFIQIYYFEVLGMFYEIFNKSWCEGMMVIEVDIEDFVVSFIFSKYFGVLKDEWMIVYVCDYLCIMFFGNMVLYELEGLFDMELFSFKEDLEYLFYVVIKVVDVLLGFGIVVVVFGIVIIMVLFGEGSQVEIGYYVVVVLVGIFFGIFVVYGFVGLLVVVLEYDVKEELNMFEVIKVCLVVFVFGMLFLLVVEFGCKVLLFVYWLIFVEFEQVVCGC